MEKLYKLTTQDYKTRKGDYNECTWGESITHRGTGRGGLCGPGWIHAYTSPELAVLLNPIHANIRNPVLWECSHSGIVKTNNGLKVGVLSLTTTNKIELPTVTTNQRVAFGLLCALEVYPNLRYKKWAKAWLNGSDRSSDAAYAARDAARDAADAAAYAAAYDAAAAAAYAAYAARDAADAAAYAARDARDAAAASRAADAARIAADAARIAAAAHIDLNALAKKALAYN